MQAALPGNATAHSNAAGPALVRCPVCRADQFAPRLTIKGMAIEACGSCGLLVQNPQPSDEQLTAIYGSNYFIGSSENDRLGAQFDLVKRATAALQLEEIAVYLRKRGQIADRMSLLEIGCGHGNMLLEARDRGYDVHGLEYSADAARVANRKLGADVVRVGAIGESTFAEGSFDICILADVIEHVRDPANFVQTVQRVLKPGGAIFIATPSIDSWSARLLGRHWMEYKPEHLFYFNATTITRLLERSGFESVAISSGRKILTLDYVIGHFDKFPVPVVSTVLNALRALTPAALLGKPLTLTASGINILAIKRR
ncbi:MAG: class I SAM-dependent methyltransferase [Alphaproteobacteria bacterium]